MAHLANGRITLWEGGSLWVLDVPALPESRKRTDFHAHHAIQITLALDGEFRLHLQDGAERDAALIVAADVSHAFEPKGIIALIFVEPESSAGRALAGTILAECNVAAIPPAQAAALRQPILDAMSRGDVNDTTWRALGQELIRQFAGGAAPSPADPRVEASLEWAMNHLEDRVSMADVAHEIGLSIDRMSHLFVEHTGLPFRTYLLWLRIGKAVEAYAQGASLTSAAHDAGFSDSAHFSRTFRRMFGIAAADLRLA
jgi:AraC family transcriptional regulator